MAWTAPRTWVAGEVVTASVMNTHINDNLDAIHTTITAGGDGPGKVSSWPYCYVERSTDWATAASWQAVPLDAVVDGDALLSSNLITIPSDAGGDYLLTWWAQASGTVTTMYVATAINGTRGYTASADAQMSVSNLHGQILVTVAGSATFGLFLWGASSMNLAGGSNGLAIIRVA